jgi:hypothetical protein
LAGSATGTPPGDQTIVGGGADIWGTADAGYYYYSTVSQPIWDAKVHVKTLEGPDNWTKCELMIRIPATPGGAPAANDPFIAAMTTRTNGQNQVGPQWRTVRGGNADWNGMGLTIRPTYPGTWLRLTREGSLITMWYGSDGTTWNKYVDIDTAKTDVVGGDNATTFGSAWPLDLLVGIAVTAHNDGDLVGGVAGIANLTLSQTAVTPVLAVVTDVQNATAYSYCDAYFSFMATNTALANGTVGGYQWYKNDVAIPNATGSKYAFLVGPSDNNAKIYCKATVQGVSLNSSTGMVTVLTSTEYAGQIKYQAWASNPSRPQINNGDYGVPSRVSAMPSFDAPLDWGGNFGARLTGLFQPPVTGDYLFYISADDDADLFISTDANPANARLIAQQEGWAGHLNWTSHGGGGSANAYLQRQSEYWTPNGTDYPWQLGIHLDASQKYFIMATHHEGGGGDNVGAYFQLRDPSGSTPLPADGTPVNFTNGLISMFSWPATTLAITQQPQDYSTFEGLDATLTVTATTDGELTPLYQWQKDQADLAGKNQATLSFSPTKLTDAGKYRCIITQPPTSLSVTSAEVTLTVNQSVFITGIVRREIWGPNGSVSRDMVNNGTAGPPTSKGFITGFDSVGGIGDNYAMKLSTWFVPAVSGNYVLLTSSDDDSDIFISTDDDPANKRLVCQQTSWNPDREWSSATGQRSSETWSPDGGATVPYAAGIPLVANTRYYIEGTMHDGTGGDSLTVYYLLKGESPPANGTVSNLRGDRVGLMLPKPTSLTVTGPQNATVHGWDQAVFSVSVATDALYPPTYQWRKGGVNIAGATRTVYSPWLTSASDTGATYDCVVSLSQFGVSNSAVATLTVLNDAVFEAGQITEEFFQNVGWTDLQAGTFGAPSQTFARTTFESPTDYGADFSRRLSGFFIPPASDNYVFFTSSDDQSDFYISTDDQPKNKRLVCQQTSWNGTRAWSNAGQQCSSTWSPDGGLTTPYMSGIPLTANQRYYVEQLMSEGGGGDNLAATFKVFSGTDPVAGDAPAFGPSNLGRMVAPAPAQRPQLTIVKVGGDVQVSWTPTGGHLETKATIDGAWSNAGTANPTSLPATGQAYFRVVVP